MKLKFYTIDDLYNYLCAKNKDMKFSKSDNTVLIVHAPGETYFNDISNGKYDESEDYKGLVPVALKACHIGLNRNKSFISEDTMKKNMDTFKNRPILANVIELDDGSYDFHAHDIEIKDDGDDEEMTYIERPVGIIPESNDAHLEYDKENDKTYLITRGYLYETYAEKALKILEDKGGKTKVSVELAITDMSFNAKEKYLEINDFYFDGVTLLGCEPDGEEIGEGMLGSELSLDDFSHKENMDFSQSDMDKLLEAVKQLSDSYKGLKKANYNSKEGGTCDSMNKFEELCEKYNVTSEDVDFDYSKMTEEELEAAFAEKFNNDDAEEDEACGTKKKKNDENSEATEDEASKKKKCDEDSEKDESATEDEACDPKKKKCDDGSVADEDEACGTGKKKKNEEDSEEGEDEESKEDEACGDGKKKKAGCSLNGNILTFEISLEDTERSLYNLLCETNEDDNEWYYPIATYSDYFIYTSYESGKYYKQGYAVSNNSVSFVGDRIEVFVHYLTSDEEASLNSMKQNYDELVKFKNEYDANAKNEVLESVDYACINDSEEFKALISEKDKYSVEEISEKADALLGKFERSKNAEKKIGFSIPKSTFRKVSTQTDTSKEKDQPYGGFLSNFKIES